MGKKAKKRAKVERNQRAVEYAIIPLLELFADVNDVMEEHDAFAPGAIHKSLGRIYRSWLDTREALDTNFDRARYRHDMKARKKKPTTPLGRELPASGALTFSMDPKLISVKNQSATGKSGKPSAKSSAKAAPSDAPVSSGRSKKKKSSGSGAGSHSESGSASSSGSKKKSTERSPKKKV